MRIFKRVGLILVVLLGSGKVAAQDDPPANPTEILVDGVTCTLSDAIMAANMDTATGGCRAGNGADVVRLSPVTGGFPFSQVGALTIFTPITLEGNNLALEIQSDTTYWFNVVQEATVSSAGNAHLTLRNVHFGQPSSRYPASGVVSSEADLTIENVTFRGFQRWAVLASGGTLTFTNTHFENNRAMYGSAIAAENADVTIIGGSFINNAAESTPESLDFDIQSSGGAIHLRNSTYQISPGVGELSFAGNKADWYGGAIWSENSSGTIQNAKFESNEARMGGAIYHGIEPTATLAITDSQFINNRAGELGGRSGNFGSNYGGAIFNAGQLSVQRSLFWGNSAIIGGAIAGDFYPGAGHDGSTAGVTLLESSTLIGNSAARGGAVWLGNMGGQFVNTTVYGNLAWQGYGGGFMSIGKTFIHNSIIAANLGGDCFGVMGMSWNEYTPRANDAGRFSGSNNLDSDQTCPASDIISGLETLPMNNGNLMISLALLEGSNAIDAGNPDFCPTHDQRGAEISGPCDIGAFEFGAMELPVIREPQRIREEEARVQAEQTALATQQYYQKQYDDFTVQIEADPANAELYFQRGSAASVFNADLALADFEKALELDPTMAQAQFQIALIYLYVDTHKNCDMAQAAATAYAEIASSADTQWAQQLVADAQHLCEFLASQAP